MPGPEYDRFIKSMKIGYEEWHDGIGYDLQALTAMTPEDRAAVETGLIMHLNGPSDWRDVEALAALKTPGAIAVLKVAATHSNPEVRNLALQVLAGSGAEPALELEDKIVRAVKDGALDLAEKHPTPKVKRALLDCARLADSTTRVSAAALLMYLCGKADSSFDWSQRPFFLRFATEDNQELRAAWTELRERTGI